MYMYTLSTIKCKLKKKVENETRKILKLTEKL